MAVNSEMALFPPPDSDDEPIPLGYGKRRTADDAIPLLSRDAESAWSMPPEQTPRHPYPNAATPYTGVPALQTSGPYAQQSSNSSVSVLVYVKAFYIENVCRERRHRVYI